MEAGKTAYRVHAHAFSIIPVVAGFLASIAITAALMFVFYDGNEQYRRGVDHLSKYERARTLMAVAAIVPFAGLCSAWEQQRRRARGASD